MVTQDDSVLNYYRNHQFNPVLIPVEQPAIWKDHLAKRSHLYERHLGLPFSFLKGRRVLEFGPNSGENALVLALFGAQLTLVEPNEQVHPRLRDLFKKFKLERQLEELAHAGVDDFAGTGLYDLVIAEGFLYTLPNRDDLLRRIARHVAPGGFGVISVNDRFGGIIEMLRRAVLYHACRLAGVGDPQSDSCLELARKLYEEDFKKLRASRTFHAWWKDMLVNPFFGTDHLWSLPEVMPVITAEGCDFHSSSPIWSTYEHGNWYKNVPDRQKIREAALSDWRANFPFFLTGIKSAVGGRAPAGDDVILAVSRFMAEMSSISHKPSDQAVFPEYPKIIDTYLINDPNQGVREANVELRNLISACRQAKNASELVQSYLKAERLRTLWGVPYVYISFQRPHLIGN